MKKKTACLRDKKYLKYLDEMRVLKPHLFENVKINAGKLPKKCELKINFPC